MIFSGAPGQCRRPVVFCEESRSQEHGFPQILTDHPCESVQIRVQKEVLASFPCRQAPIPLAAGVWQCENASTGRMVSSSY
jgi:hypothetical protein